MNNELLDLYLENLSASVHKPIFKIELLRKGDETPYADFTGQIVDGSGNISLNKEDGIRRTCNFSLANHNGELTSFANNLSLGDMFRVWLGESINGRDILFNQGTYLFNNPTCSSNQGDRQISINGSDKWSLLNGAHGGIIEGTYIVYAGSTFGDMVRRTLNLDIVADPIPPNIHPRLENAEVTYDITKTSGNTIADIILDVALNIGAYVYYDADGRFTAIPMDEDIYKPSAYIFEEGNVTYFSSSRTIGLEDVYNSVLVISENVTETQDVIMKELQNNDTTDPNSIVNCGRKKVYVVPDYLAGISTQELCDARAVYELRKIKEKYSALTIDCLSILFLNEGDVIQIDVPDMIQEQGYSFAEENRYLITGITRNIGTDISTTMSVISLRSL